ncbi:MAG TPA: hypothetical protein VKB08_20300 [Bradyrhizobium sp.]|nr:hypothetical protein [Bradyrhizobium sp.]
MIYRKPGCLLRALAAGTAAEQYDGYCLNAPTIQAVANETTK